MLVECPVGYFGTDCLSKCADNCGGSGRVSSCDAANGTCVCNSCWMKNGGSTCNASKKIQQHKTVINFLL